MPKNVKILQDSEEKILKKVIKIQTQLANGNNGYWVPEDEYPLGVLSVSEDGIYYPSSDPNGPYYGYSKINVSGVGTTVMGQLADIVITGNGTYEAATDTDGPYYGYSKVTVNVSDSGEGGSHSTITGKDSDGDDAIARIDDDGKIVTSKLPTRIAINTYPNNLVYEDGQLIDFTGLLVKAFLPNDTEWGNVPDDELIKPVKTSKFTGAKDQDTIGDATISDTTGLSQDTINSMPIGYGTKIVGTMGQNYETGTAGSMNNGITSLTNTSPVYTFAYGRNDTTVTAAACSLEPFNGTYADHNPGGNSVYTRNFEGSRFVVNEKALYVTQVGGSGNWEFVSPPFTAISNLTEIAYVILYGVRNEKSIVSQQTMPIQWKRPGGKVLKTSFNIAVHGS